MLYDAVGYLFQNGCQVCLNLVSEDESQYKVESLKVKVPDAKVPYSFEQLIVKKTFHFYLFTFNSVIISTFSSGVRGQKIVVADEITGILCYNSWKRKIHYEN